MEKNLREILRSNGLTCYESKLMELCGSQFYALDFDRIEQICEETERSSSLKRRKLERVLLRLRYAGSKKSTSKSFSWSILSIIVLCASYFIFVSRPSPKERTSKSRWEYHSLPYVLLSDPPNDETISSHSNFTYMDEMRDRKYVVICAGSRRSGSTWQYHAARMILTLADPSRRLVEGARSSDKVEEITSILSSTPQSIHGHDIQPYIILKVHEYREEWADLATHVFTSHRDPRDVYYSVKRVQMEWEMIKSKGGEENINQVCSRDVRLASDASLCAMAVFRENYLKWVSSSSKDVRLHDMHYESVFDDTEESILEEIRSMIRVLGFQNHVSVYAVRFAVEQFYRHRAETLRAHATLVEKRDDKTRYNLSRTWDAPKDDGDEGEGYESMDKEYSYMHIRHVENPLHGQSRTFMSPTQVQAVEEVFQDWIRDGGYKRKSLRYDDIYNN